GVPIERVIDDIAVMGFSREEVRNVLRELTAQGKPVDMNCVLDRLSG
ncbi:MAG: UBA-like domain-containing protein, partial [Sulfitobacter sp.]|nr:UBA-like domain-containing protein [Sulfitobacter sp.]